MFRAFFIAVVFVGTCVSLSQAVCKPDASTCDECLEKAKGSECEWCADINFGLHYGSSPRCMEAGLLENAGCRKKHVMMLSKSEVKLVKQKKENAAVALISPRKVILKTTRSQPVEIPIQVNVPDSVGKKDRLIVVLKKHNKFDVEFLYPQTVLGTWKEKRSHKFKVRKLTPNEKIDFTLKLTLKADSTLFGTEKLRMKVKLGKKGVKTSVDIRVSHKHGCGCKVQHAAPECNGHGDKSCGVCSCHASWIGQACDVSFEGDDIITGDCINPHIRSRVKCSGRGTCVVGACECDSLRHRSIMRYSGKYCQCDDTSCPYSNGQLCGGPAQGRCECGRCNCKEEYTGDACGCQMSNHNCMDARGRLCSGHGICECGRCICDEPYKGRDCSRAP